MPRESFGGFFKRRRHALGLTLRSFCAKNRIDGGNLSKLERGVLPPPESHEKLEEYARMLELREGSDDWLEFFDLAAAGRGRLPRDLADDPEVVRRLPILFRTLRGERVEDAKLDRLVHHLRDDRSGRAE